MAVLRRYVSRGNTLTGLGYGANYPSSVNPVKVGGTFYLPYYNGYGARVYTTTDGITIASEITPYSDATATTYRLTETALAYLNGVWLHVARQNTGPSPTYAHDHGYYIVTSEDLETWSAVADGHALTPNLTANTHPALLALGNKFYLFAGDRENYPVYNADSKLWVYSTTPERVLADATDWDLELSIARPGLPGTQPMYGYPQLTLIDGDTVEVRVASQVWEDQVEYLTTITGFGAVTATADADSVNLNWSGVV